MRESPGIIAVFAKPPRAGQVKTRLAGALDANTAALLARAFFADTWSALGQLVGARRVLASTSEELAPFGLREGELWLQGDGDLGARMERIASRALAEAPWFIALGADSPGLPLAAVEAAKAAFVHRDAALGPADDGGYYLLGLRRLEPGLLAGLPWSAPNTFEATRERLGARGYSTATLQPWFDVDTLADLQRLKRALDAGEVQAPRTAELLAKLRLP
jgi:rSAM/selenodomain-associated transferase 1